ncbi:MAG TPA: ribosomal L7Ae/L30e/S12e/Gadd45 family protein [Candidatus Nanoarchaeia archaeon]|nr:ribosomal L7Ae/L30e/S12e/Gadd45 family protein [Candidatus Nanoarchaeia archaeon]
MAEQLTVAELKKTLKGENVVIGTQRTLKELKRGSIERVFVTSNCPPQVEQDIDYYTGLGQVEKVKLSMPNEELGVICKKPFSISVVSLLKGGQ